MAHFGFVRSSASESARYGPIMSGGHVYGGIGLYSPVVGSIVTPVPQFGVPVVPGVPGVATTRYAIHDSSGRFVSYEDRSRVAVCTPHGLVDPIFGLPEREVTEVLLHSGRRPSTSHSHVSHSSSHTSSHTSSRSSSRPPSSPPSSRPVIISGPTCPYCSIRLVDGMCPECKCRPGTRHIGRSRDSRDTRDSDAERINELKRLEEKAREERLLLEAKEKEKAKARARDFEGYTGGASTSAGYGRVRFSDDPTPAQMMNRIVHGKDALSQFRTTHA